MSLGQGREASGGVSRSHLPPSELNKKRRDEIAAAAQAVLDARALYPTASPISSASTPSVQNQVRPNLAQNVQI